MKLNMTTGPDITLRLYQDGADMVDLKAGSSFVLIVDNTGLARVGSVNKSIGLPVDRNGQVLETTTP